MRAYLYTMVEWYSQNAKTRGSTMSTFNITSDTDNIHIRGTAKHVIDIMGLEDGTVILISPTEYNIIENGALKYIEAKHIDSTLLGIFSNFENVENKPKYPYMVIVEDLNEVKHE